MSLALLRALLLPLLAGAGLARGLGLRPRSAPLSFMAWSYALGALAAALATFVWLLLPLGRSSPLAPELAVAALGAAGWAAGRRVAPLSAAPRCAAPRAERLLCAAAVLFACVLAAQRILDGDLVPIFQDDEAHVWALKAKVIYAAGGFNAALERALADPNYVYHRDYPLLIPLLEVWTFAHFGEVTHVVSRLPVQLFSLALAFMLADGLVRVVRPAAAAALVLVVLDCETTRYQGRTAHADLAVALGLLLALDAWLRWRGTGERGWLRLCAAGAALALFAKGEALLYAAAAGAGLAAARLLRGRALGAPRAGLKAPRAWLLFPAGIVLLTWTFNAWWGFTSDIGATDNREESFVELVFLQAPERLPAIAAFVGRDLLPDRRWAGHLPSAFLVLALFLAPRLRRDALGVPALAFLLAWAGLVVVFLGTPHAVDWQLSTAFPRVAWQLAPALALWVGAAAGRFLPAFAPRSDS